MNIYSYNKFFSSLLHAMHIQEIQECQDTLELVLDAFLLSRHISRDASGSFSWKGKNYLYHSSLSRINTDSVYAEFTDGVRHCRSSTKSCIH